MTRTVFAVMMAVSLMGLNAAAQSTPDDQRIKTYCKMVSDVAGGSYRIEQSCIRMERAARLAVLSSDAPPRIRTYCKMVSDVAGGSYRIEQSCIRMESRAKGNIEE